MRTFKTIPGVLLLGLAACGSTPVEEHHYSLLLDALNHSTPVAEKTTDARLIVASIELPEYLRSSNLVMQVADNEVLPARRHFWAEPLDESIRHVLAHDLDRRLEATKVRRGAKSGDGCLLVVEFERFHPTDDARVVVSGYYTLQSAAAPVEREFDVSRSLPEGGYANAVSELRIALGELADGVATQVQSSMDCGPASRS